MFRPQVSVDESNSWGLGWEIHRAAGGMLIQHQGGQTGVQAFTAASVAQRSGYVILTNSANGWKVFYNDRFGRSSTRYICIARACSPDGARATHNHAPRQRADRPQRKAGR
jgi:hypothetical protein